MRVWSALLIGTCLLPGCFDGHTPREDAGPVDGGGVYLSCEQARDDVAVGEPCVFAARCEDRGPCCTTAWTCTDGVVATARDCLETCWRACADALEGAAEGDACEGVFDCTDLAHTPCCSRSVLCSEGRIQLDETCTPGCE